MTRQIPDTLRLDQVAYDLLPHDGPELWRPEAAAVPVVMSSTACWRGYVCAYAVSQGRLVLDSLRAMVGRYDADETFVAVPPPAIHGRFPTIHPPGQGQNFNATYRDLDLAIDYTGFLAIGQNPVDDFGWVESMPWDYGTVLGLHCDHGIITGKTDLSDAMNEVRAALQHADLTGAQAVLARHGMAWLAPRLRAQP